MKKEDRKYEACGNTMKSFFKEAYEPATKEEYEIIVKKYVIFMEDNFKYWGLK